MSHSSSVRRSKSGGHRGPHAIRIIGGDWKRTPLPVFSLDGLRPTPGRVRETLFNWLGQDLRAWRCLDLFAGSGALGFEAASRGAARVVMVESHPRIARQLRANKEKLGAHAIEIVEADALRCAARLAPAAFDMVFVDPPFDDPKVFSAVLALAVPLVATGGRLYVESGALLAMEAHPVLAKWQIVKHGKAGAVYYHLLQHSNDE